MRADVRWAACRKVCVLGRAQPEVTVNTSSRPVASCDGSSVALAAFRKRLPEPMALLAGAAVSFEANTLTLSGPAGGMTSAAFFPVDRPGITYETAVVRVDNDRFRVVTRVGLTPHNAGDEPMVLAGLVTLGEKFRHFRDATPFLPGSRPGALRGVAEQPIPLLIGLVVAALLRYYHSSLFG